MRETEWSEMLEETVRTFWKCAALGLITGLAIGFGGGRLSKKTKVVNGTPAYEILEKARMPIVDRSFLSGQRWRVKLDGDAPWAEGRTLAEAALNAKELTDLWRKFREGSAQAAAQ